jgi:hypothetical protein
MSPTPPANSLLDALQKAACRRPRVPHQARQRLHPTRNFTGGKLNRAQTNQGERAGARVRLPPNEWAVGFAAFVASAEMLFTVRTRMKG